MKDEAQAAAMSTIVQELRFERRIFGFKARRVACYTILDCVSLRRIELRSLG